MIGAYITFAAVVVIVTIYMLIVHSFLRSSENPQDEQRERELQTKTADARSHRSGQPQYAH